MRKIIFQVSGDLQQVIIARLSEYDIDGAEEKEESIEVYVEDNQYQLPSFQNELSSISKVFNVSPRIEKLEDENWNAKWEAGYQPVEIGNKVRIRASFHKPDENFRYEILIDPKMSFGTGHHPTTTLVIKRMLDHDFTRQNVLDMGCGTGVLGILAAMKEASQVDAIDIDPWSFENAQQNAELNDIGNIAIIQGGIEKVPPRKYGTILANINREIIISQLPEYRKHLIDEGILITSGFLKNDESKITAEAEKAGFERTGKLNDSDWLLMEFKAIK